MLWIEEMSLEDREELIDELINMYDEIGDPFGRNYLRKHKYTLSDRELYQYYSDVKMVEGVSKSIGMARGALSRFWSTLPTWSSDNKYNNL
ncbi:hypothetical protein D3C80_1918400 [compost metagenome]